jgi:hypothetical protein
MPPLLIIAMKYQAIGRGKTQPRLTRKPFTSRHASLRIEAYRSLEAEGIWARRRSPLLDLARVSFRR